MAYVREYTNDVFVSYAHADNEPNPVGICWVNQFIQNLETELRRRLGGTRDLKIFFDHRNLQGNDHLRMLLEHARSSAIFIAILSPSYAERTWTRDELAAFGSVATEPGRIFVVELLPVEERDAKPQQISHLNATEFWWTDAPISDVPYVVTPTVPADNRYINRLQDLAAQLRTQLRRMRDGGNGESHQPDAAVATTNSPAILLAQTTDDLDEDREQVRRYLNQYGLQVLPEKTYPQGGLEFANAFRRDIKRARLFVQLLGPLASRQPPDLPTSYGQFQYQTAKAAGLKTLLWRRPGVDFAGVNHHDRALLSEPDVLAMGLETFKAEILRCSQPQPIPEKRVKTDPLIFINADPTDSDLANTLHDEFKRHDCPVAMRAQQGSAESINKDLEENIVESDGIIFVYGRAEQTWVRGQLRLYNRLKPQRQKPPRVLAIYKCPPEPKAAIGMAIPEAREIDCSHQFTLQPVQDIVAEIRE